MAVVDQLWRYPAKSMLGEQLDAADVTSNGILGDRGWAVRDEVRGGIRGAKKIAGLMNLSARYLEPPTRARPSGPVEITLPDGSVVRTTDRELNARLSEALDHEVTLWPLRPPADLDHYRRGAPDSDDLLTELRAIFGREIDEPLPDLSVFPPEILEFESPPGSYVDAFPLLILTTGSLRTLQTLLPDSVVDVRRFRPNVLLDAESDPDDPWPELAWVGRRATIGTAVVEMYVACPRCVMVTRPFADVPGDSAVLRRIVADADQNLGVYATVVEPGEMRLGDELILQ